MKRTLITIALTTVVVLTLVGITSLALVPRVNNMFSSGPAQSRWRLWRRLSGDHGGSACTG